MEAINITEIVKPFLERKVGIEQIWREHEDEIRAIDEGKNADEVWALSIIYYNYGTYLDENGYKTESLKYIDEAIQLFVKGKHFITPKEYDDTIEKMLQTKAFVLVNLEKLKEALAYFKMLKERFPFKDTYRIHYHNCFQAMINKWVNPIYVVLAICMAVYAFVNWVLKPSFFPGWLFDICWYSWIVLLVAQFVVPWVVKVLDKK